MVKPTKIKPVFLLGFILIVLIAAVGSTSADQIDGQGNITEQENMMICCPHNGAHMMRCMMGNDSMMKDHMANGTMMQNMYHMHHMMGDHAGNGTMMMNEHSSNESMMHCMMDAHSGNESNETMMHCMQCMMGMHAGNMTGMGTHPANETMMHCMMGNDSMMKDNMSNGTMMHCMHCMMGDHAGNGTMMMKENSGNNTMMCCHCMMQQNDDMAQKRLDCASFWLKQAIEIHELHLSDPKEATNESSQIEMMNQMMKAYACLTGENMTENMTMHTMTNMTTAHALEAH